MNVLKKCLFPSPIGMIRMIEDDKGLVSLSFTDDGHGSLSSDGELFMPGNDRDPYGHDHDKTIKGLDHDGIPLAEHGHTVCLDEACHQLFDYFAGKRQSFDLPLSPTGTPFQRDVWDELARIPYGTTRTFQEIARLTGHEKAARAIAMAAGRNPLPIIIPSHRLVGRDGSPVGFGEGLWRKEYLLTFEIRVSGSSGRRDETFCGGSV